MARGIRFQPIKNVLRDLYSKSRRRISKSTPIPKEDVEVTLVDVPEQSSMKIDLEKNNSAISPSSKLHIKDSSEEKLAECDGKCD